MNSCPVCEAPAVAEVCEVCGHAFAHATSAEAPISRLPDLDVPPALGDPAPVVPLFELEPTRFASAMSPAVEADVDLERTSVADVPDVAAGGLVELDTGREATAAERTQASPDQVTCRYCRNVQTSGLMCERCGMRLPWNLAVAVSASVTVDRDALVRCQRCGVRTYQRERCAGCGVLLAREV